ncbi:unnamed protein product [Zymoseptoria tritici ST99CH_1A5]|uniref:Uncharacterized protein n=1 Tax=Zymoseptoria tritici ST99CH_1A5 TaxID=1276529 RepID=A0A1Y6LF91_ZYMTR|nr:unnamed protein product [Zymoseptoria tritici ST99CH_1A5]
MFEPTCVQRWALRQEAAKTAQERLQPISSKQIRASCTFSTKEEEPYQFRPAAKNKEAKAQLEQSNAELEEARKRISALEKGKTALQGEYSTALQQAREETRTAVRDLDEQKELLKASTTTLEGELREKDDLLEFRWKKIVKQKTEIVRLEETGSRRAAEYEGLENAIEDLRWANVNLRSANAAVSKETEGENVELKIEICELKGKTVAVDHRIKMLEGLVEEYGVDLRDSELRQAKISKLRGERLIAVDVKLASKKGLRTSA